MEIWGKFINQCDFFCKPQNDYLGSVYDSMSRQSWAYGLVCFHLTFSFQLHQIQQPDLDAVVDPLVQSDKVLEKSELGVVGSAWPEGKC